ncbi:prepilin-type N-terminal cleavage/methylation domain-containing protein [Microbacterium sp. 22303]|uniref:prepilin-type N-terminal cleavage/methylation domain-containing protein n=1 Tax=Microbacterium sp. 22303 TaxID=3453905 RepID=UPI003F831691
MGQLSSVSGDRNHPELVGLAQGTRRFTECVLPENDSLKWGHAMLTIRRAIDAKIAAREKGEEEAGFSLIELIIVVVIIGILVAIAIPLFGFIQKTSVDGATQSSTKNASTTAVADFASAASAAAGATKANADLGTMQSGNLTLKLETSGTAGLGDSSSAASICVSGFNTDGQKYILASSAFFSGPGAKSDGTGCR